MNDITKGSVTSDSNDTSNDDSAESIAMFRDSARSFLGAVDQRQRVRALEAAGGGFDRATWCHIAELGWCSIGVPEADGGLGLGLGLAEVAAIAEEVGRQLLPEPFLDAGVQPLALLAALPPSALRSELLAGLQDGSTVAGVAWQERAGELTPGEGLGKDTRNDKRNDNGPCRATLLTPGGDIARLTGQKRFVRPGPGADGWIVNAELDNEMTDGPDAGPGAGLALFWVTATVPGLKLETQAGVDGSAIATLVFDAAEARLLARGEAAQSALNTANDIARIAQGAELLGIARRALELTCDYLRTREQFGKPIGSFQALQHRLVDGLIQVELAAACLRDGLATVAASPSAGAADAPRTLAIAASRIKARCAHAAVDMTRLAIQLHGAIGTTNEYDIGLYFKRAMTLASRWGNAGAHRRRWSALVTQPAGAEVARGAAISPAKIPGASAASSTPAAPQMQAAAAPSDAALADDFSPDLDWPNVPEAEFRRRVRALFAAHYPAERRYRPYRQTWAESKGWYLTLARLGWLAPAWPKQYGGMGLPADKLIAYIEESEAWGVARPPDQGLVMIGPILMRFGTEAQRQRFLPKVLAGEHVWTQGYSEPNAGSDLASVRCEAIQGVDAQGEHFIVNGQKTWTTWGADGTHMFMLVRTDKTVKKQAGISFLLVDLKSPGITVRPIRNIAAEQEFCEVFFDDVRVPRDHLVGELNQGWTVAKALLGFERLFTGSPKHSQHTLHQVEKLARQRGLFDDPAFVARFAELQLDTADLGAAYSGYAELAKRGEPIPPSISMLKIWSTETYERLALLLIESAQDYGACRDHCHTDEIDLHVVAPLFNALGAKIFAGSNEIQRNILAKAVLDLPG